MPALRTNFISTGPLRAAVLDFISKRSTAATPARILGAVVGSPQSPLFTA
jgi:hypothetical protein